MLFRRQPDTLTAETFSQLYAEHLDAVFNYCLYRIGDRQLAEDLTANIFEQVWRDRHRYDAERASLVTWLYAIARHRVIDEQRRQGQQGLVPLDQAHEDKAPLPEEQVARAERLLRLRNLVQALPDEQQELIALKFGAELTNRSIAELLNRSETAVGSAIYRVMEKLRERWPKPMEEIHHE